MHLKHFVEMLFHQKGRFEHSIPITPVNCTLIPVCSNLFPSFGLTVTAPLTDSPSIYSGAFSFRFLSSFISTDGLSSLSSRTISMSTGVEKKNEDIVFVDCFAVVVS